MKMALVHDWLTTFSGAEQVVDAICQEFPEIELFSLIDTMDKRAKPLSMQRPVQTSFLDKLPFIGRFYRYTLPIMPLAIEQFSFADYDVVISNSSSIAKGIITGPYQLHICYCNSPMRYAWDLQSQYVENQGLFPLVRWLMKWQLHNIRIWDIRTANGVDHFVSNSDYIGHRIWKVYRRHSTTVYPPVDVESFVQGKTDREDFYLTASRLVPYKKIDAIVRAFNDMPDRKLVVIGDGPELKSIKRLAGPNVQLLGYQPFPVLLDHMQRTKAFIFAAEEDFGIVPVEAQACGTPVIAFGRGGTAETVTDDVTGVQFHSQTPSAIADAVRRFEARSAPWDPVAIREGALRFNRDRFRKQFRALVEDRYAQFTADRSARPTEAT